jgi:rod shape determining protein RodA
LGSAGLWGKGFGQGTQTKLGFLPEAQTDFIFPAFVEEWGIVGAVVLLLSYFCLIYRIAVIGIRAYGNFYKFFCLGAMILFSFQLLINIGSTLGFIPVIGVVFPLLSYGGSNFLTSFLILGIIQNIAVQSNA